MSTEGPSPSPGEGGVEVEAEATSAVLFIIVCLCIGAFCKYFLSFTRVPYTAMLLLFGVGVGFLQLAPSIQSLDSCLAFTQTLYLWMGMDPSLLLLVFLPIIGFSAAIAQEPHMLRRNWGQIMVLAWPGVVLGFVIIAICAKYFFPYNWSWTESLLFGSMMSATDPVAVVAVLQEVGASQKLANVIDGESLMNDGSALVIFSLLKSLADGNSMTVAQGVLLFVRLAVVGVLLGVAFGLGTSVWLRFIHNDSCLTIIVTLLSAYASFFTAEEMCGASGLLSVVMNGFTCSVLGGRQVTLRVEHSMHAFWGALEWIANTILFIWMGIVFAFVIKPPDFVLSVLPGVGDTLTPSDIGYAVVLYLWLLVARAALIAVCYYPFKYFGYPMDWRTSLVFIWSGLRGAVGMVMALYIFLDNEIFDKQYKSHCVFFMAVMALMTVLINGSSIKGLLQYLGFMSHTPQQLGVLQHVIQGMAGIEARHLSSLEFHELLGDPDWDAVRMWAHVDTEKLLQEVQASLVPSPLSAKAIQGCATPRSGAGDAAEQQALTHEQLQIVYDYRLRLLRMVKTLYAEMFNEHQIDLGVVQGLQEATDKAIDRASQGLMDWKYVEAEATLPAWVLWLQSLEKRTKLRSVLIDVVVNKALISSLSAVATFISAHTHAQRQFRNHLENLTGVHHDGSPEEAEEEEEEQEDAVGDVVVRESVMQVCQLLATSPSRRHGSEEVPPSPGLGPEATSPSLGAELQELQGAPQVLVSIDAGGGPQPTARSVNTNGSRARGLASPRTPSAVTQLVGLVLAESEAGIEVAKRFCERLVVPHPSLATWLRSRNVAAAILTKQREFVAHIAEAGLVEPREITRLQEEVDAAYSGIVSSQSVVAAAMRFAGHRIDVNDLPLFESLGAAECKELLRHSHWRMFASGSCLHLAGEEVTEVAILCEGNCLLEFPAASEEDQHKVIASVGDPLGLAEVMLGCRRLCSVHVDTVVHCLVLPLHVLQRALHANARVMKRAWQATAAHLAAQHNDILGVWKQLAPLNLHFRECDIVHCKAGMAVHVHHSAVLITGTLLKAPAGQAAARAPGGAPGKPGDGMPLVWHAPCELAPGVYSLADGDTAGATLSVVPRDFDKAFSNNQKRIVARRRKGIAKTA